MITFGALLCAINSGVETICLALGIVKLGREETKWAEFISNTMLIGGIKQTFLIFFVEWNALKMIADLFDHYCT